MTFGSINILSAGCVGLPQAYRDKYYDLSQVSKYKNACLPGLVTTYQS